ncbi:MAG: hypothetical protein ACK5UE_01450 [Chitinophagales bacterium]|jgi:hypothetical protein|nr:hypothetical protein [Sphingobacteriales bacterium]
MNRELRYTLVGDGRSDIVLLNIINWLLNDLYPKLPTNFAFADFSNLKNPPNKSDVERQLKFAELYYPFDILFYHRDAEINKRDIIFERKNEVFSKLTLEYKERVICIVPKIMMETWLLISEDALKMAAGNRQYSEKIYIPPLGKLENIKYTKGLLHQELKKINGCKRKFNPYKAAHLVAEYIEDYSPLRNLDAFNEFEKDLIEKVNIWQKTHLV